MPSAAAARERERESERARGRKEGSVEKGRYAAPHQERIAIIGGLCSEAADRPMAMRHHAEKIDALRTLGVRSDASEANIKSAYLNLAKQHHPDVGGSTSQFQAVLKAYETLTGPSGRGGRSVAEQYADLMAKRAQEPLIIRWFWRGPAFRVKMQIKLATCVVLFAMALWDEQGRATRRAQIYNPGSSSR